MSNSPMIFPGQRRPGRKAMHGYPYRIAGLGTPDLPPTGPSVLAPFNPVQDLELMEELLAGYPPGGFIDPTQAFGDPGGDPVEAMTEMDEGTGGGNSGTRPDLPPWIYQPTNWENIDQINYALVPAIGSSATIITYVVPPGRNGVINKIACNFVGGGWTEGSGDILWRVLVDGTPPPGATSYNAILASLGSPASPTGVAGFRIFENQVLTLVAFNNPLGASGGVVVAGQRVGARFAGWNYPTDIEESDIWI